MRGVFLAATMLMATPALADEVWDLTAAPNGTVFGGSTIFLSSPSSIATVVSAFGGGSLVEKNLGGSDVGLGLTNGNASEPNEITMGNFVQFDLSNLSAAQKAAVSVGITSVEDGETWGIGLSNSPGSLGTITQTGMDNGIQIVNAGSASFLTVTDTNAGGGILVNELDAPGAAGPPTGVPEPGAMGLLGGGLAMLGFVRTMTRMRGR